MGAFRCAKGVNKMNVIIDLNKLTCGTLRMIGQDYDIEGDIILDEFVDNTVNKLEEDTNRFKEELKEAVINAVKSIKIDIIK